jgi:hypothetical protein
MGRNDRRARVIGYDSCTFVVKSSIFGYISRGEIVPEVIMTEENRSNTGLIAIAASKHVK